MGRASGGILRYAVLGVLLAVISSALWLIPNGTRPPLSADSPVSADSVAAAATPTVAPVAGGNDLLADLPGPPAASRAPSTLPARYSGYIWPLVGAKITTYFAVAASGSMILGGLPVHNGLDLALPCGTPIRAAHDGKVLYAGRRADPYLGFSSSVQPYYDELARRKLTEVALPIIVVVDDGNGLRSVYVHLAKATVKKGQVVAAGDTIGLEGMTGNATGCHLHYSLFLADGPWVPVAPMLVKKWLYPGWMRLRIDPLTVLPLDSPDAARPVAGLTAPAKPPHYQAPPFERVRPGT